MSTDSDRLHNLLCKTTNGPWRVVGEYADGEPLPDTSRMLRGAGGEHLGIMHAPDAELAALAPELADTLLWLRDGVEDLYEITTQVAGTYREIGVDEIAEQLEPLAQDLARLLERGTE